jgi:alcohol dehydrogenase class IV
MDDPVTFTLEAAGQVEFGPGTVEKLPALVGAGRVLLVTDQGLRTAGIADRVEKILSGVDLGVYDKVAANPSTANVAAGAAVARTVKPQVVVALGGGSVLDAAKAIALSVQVGVIAVPTTAGTGAETNGFGVIEDVAARRKVYLGDASVRPRLAILDPELTVGLSPMATAATGFDALIHGVESLASRGRNAVSEAYAAKAVELVGRWLPVAYADGGDLEARSQLMLGAHLAGRALTISGLGLIHGFAHAITAYTGTPHGVALATVAEKVMELSPASYAADLIMPPLLKKPLRKLGVERDMLPALAATALADAVTRNSPHIPSQTEAEDLLAAVY